MYNVSAKPLKDGNIQRSFQLLCTHSTLTDQPFPKLQGHTCQSNVCQTQACDSVIGAVDARPQAFARGRARLWAVCSPSRHLPLSYESREVGEMSAESQQGVSLGASCGTWCRCHMWRQGCAGKRMLSVLSDNVLKYQLEHGGMRACTSLPVTLAVQHIYRWLASWTSRNIEAPASS